MAKTAVSGSVPRNLILFFGAFAGGFCALWLLSTTPAPDAQRHNLEIPPGAPLNLEIPRAAPAEVYDLPMLHLPKWYNETVWSKTEYIEGVDDAKTYDERRAELDSTNGDREDKTLMEFFFNGVRGGLVLEFGALNGLSLSASRPLEQFFGWRSILFEANKGLATQLATNRPNALSFNAAVCKEKKTLHFKPAGDVGVILELASPVFLQSFHGDVLDESKTELDPSKLKKQWEVLCLPLGPILEQLRITHLDAAIFDCEGCELEALQSVDFNKIDIDVLVVETNRFNHKEDIQPVLDYMARYPQYEVAIRTLGRNTWFMKKGFVRRQSDPTATLPEEK